MLTGSFGLHGIPDVAVEVIVAGEEEPTALAEGDRCDTTDDVIVAVHGQLLVGAHVEQSTCRVVATRRERPTIREKLQRHTQTFYLETQCKIYKNVQTMKNGLINIKG